MYDIYLASPFFNEEQVERRDTILRILREYNLKVFSPEESIRLEFNASSEERSKCFEENCSAIRDSSFVFAITNGKDMGTIWEAGFAFGAETKVIYFAENLQGPFNVMLGESAVRVITSRKELQNLLHDNILFKYEKYNGGTE